MESNHYTGRRKVGGIVPVFTTRLTQILNIKIKEDQRGVHREGGGLGSLPGSGSRVFYRPDGCLNIPHPGLTMG